MRSILIVGLMALFMAGCSTLEAVPNPTDVISKPLGTESIKIGMTKDEVKDQWGEPDSITTEEIKETKRVREVWTYHARYTSLPVDAGYLSKTQKLYFDGNNLTDIKG
ncbi:MAG: hypothetical protein PHS37_08130 [Candidatus Omnitrophica bacterium]|nr:hypothetical protein [Candidatus Omnitrophota bacterium]